MVFLLEMFRRLSGRRIAALALVLLSVFGLSTVGLLAFEVSMGMHSWLSAVQIWHHHRQNLITCTRNVVEHNDPKAMARCDEALRGFDTYSSMRAAVEVSDWQTANKRLIDTGLSAAEADAALDLFKMSGVIPRAASAIEVWSAAQLEVEQLRLLVVDYQQALDDPTTPMPSRRSYMRQIDQMDAQLQKHERRFATILQEAVPGTKYTGAGAFGLAVLLLVGSGVYMGRLARRHEKGRARAEHRLMQRERSYQALVEHLHEPICAIDTTTGRVEEANAAFWALLSRDSSEVGPLFVDDFLAESPQAAQSFLRSLRNGRTGLVERVWRTGEDPQRVMQMVTCRIPDATSRVFLLARDVTELREYEATMMEVDRMLAVGTLAAGVGHEINNPLTYVAGGIEYAHECLSEILEEADEWEFVAGNQRRRELLGQVGDVLEALDDAREGTRRVRDIAQDLRTFARHEQVAEVEPVAIEPVVELALAMADHEIRHRARLVCRYEDDVTAVANESRLAQVFLNLVINAAQAIEEGAPADNEVSVSAFYEGEEVVVEITDSGAGITEDQRAMVFEPFRTTKAVGKGTGLGLAISRNIVESMGGQIGFESTPGESTTFWVRLPAASR